MLQLFRTVDPGISLLSSAEVCTAIHPVGQPPKDALDDYVDAITRFKHVSLSASRSFYRDPPLKTPFEYLDWATGLIHFRFQQAELCRRRSRLVDLHWQRQVVVVVGLVYGPATASIEAAYADFSRACKALYPGSLVQRCFIVEPSEEQLRQAGSASAMRDLVVFPPGGLAHFRQHLEVWMHDLTALLLTELEKWVLDATSPGVADASGRLGAAASYADSPEFTGSSAVMEEVTKRLTLSDDEEARERRRRSRLLKAQGDACFMAGTPRDAYEHYRSCAEASKEGGDSVWYGAALEGMAAARLVMTMCGTATYSSATGSPSRPRPFAALDTPHPSAARSLSNPPSQSQVQVALDPATSEAVAGARRQASGVEGPVAGDGPTPAPSVPRQHLLRRSHAAGLTPRTMWEAARRSGVEGEVRELMAEARVAYRRRGGCPALQVEQHLKLIRFAVCMKGLQAARKEVLELAEGVLELVGSLALPEDRLTCLAEVGHIQGALGHPRRRTLLLWQAVELGRSLPPPPPLSQSQQPPAPGQPVLSTIERAELVRLVGSALEPPPDLEDDGWGVLEQPGGGGGGGGEPIHRAPSGRADFTTSVMPAPTIRPHFAQLAAACAAPPPRGLAWLPGFMFTGQGRAGQGQPWPLPLCGLWETVRLGLLEAALSSARQAGSGVDAWEAAAALLRDHHVGMTTTTQANLLEVMVSAAAATSPAARARLALGLPLVAQLRRVLPHRHPLQPVALAVAPTSGRLAVAAGGGGRAGGGGPRAGAATSPFIFSAAKRQPGGGVPGGADKPDGPPPVPQWVCGEDCSIEVALVNPLAVPVRLEGVHAVMAYSPGLPGTPMSPPPPLGAGFLSIASEVAAAEADDRATEAEGDGPAWTPFPAGILLAPRSKPTRLVLSGRAARPGTYTLLCLRVAAGGATWLQPLLPPGSLPREVAALPPPGPPRPPPPPDLPPGRGREATRPAPAPLRLPIHALTQQPRLRAHLSAGPDASLVAPSDEDLGLVNMSVGGAAISGGGAVGGGGLLPKSDVLPVWEGQVASWTLKLTNESPDQAITHCDVGVFNTKGAPLKALGPGHLHAAVAGPHLELDVAGLQAALPLQPGASVVLPALLRVGRLPKKGAIGHEDEVTLQVRVLYAAAPPADAEPPPSATQPALTGRRTELPVTFRLQAALQVSAIGFLDYFTPMLGGVRVAQPAMPPPPGTVPSKLPGLTSGPELGGAGARGRLLSVRLDRSDSMEPGATQRMAALDLCTPTGHRRTPSQAGGASSNKHPQGPPPSPGGAAALTLRDPRGAYAQEVELSDGAAAGDLLVRGSQAGLPPLPERPPSAILTRSGLSILDRTGLPGRDAGLGAGGEGVGGVNPEGFLRVGLAGDAVLTVAVTNQSQRYVKVWLANVAGRSAVQQLAAPESQLGLEVLQPDGATLLWAPMLAPPPTPSTATDAAAGTPPADAQPPAALPSEADRFAAAEALCAGWALCYQLIGGEDGRADARAGVPHGVVRLAAMDAARPPPVYVSLEALHRTTTADASAAGGAWQPLLSMQSGVGRITRTRTLGRTTSAIGSAAPTAKPLRLRNLGRLLAEQGLVAPHGIPAEELWGLQLVVGHTLPIQVTVTNRSGSPIHVSFSVSAQHEQRPPALSGSESVSLAWWQPRPPLSAQPSGVVAAQAGAGEATDGQHGVLITGLGPQPLHVALRPGASQTLQLELLCLQPGFYQLSATQVQAAVVAPPPLPLQAPGGNAAGPAAPVAAPPLRSVTSGPQPAPARSLQQQLSAQLGEAMGSGMPAGGGSGANPAEASPGAPPAAAAAGTGAGPPGAGHGGAGDAVGLQLQALLERGRLPHVSPLHAVYASTDRLNFLAVLTTA